MLQAFVTTALLTLNASNPQPNLAEVASWGERSEAQQTIYICYRTSEGECTTTPPDDRTQEDTPKTIDDGSVEFDTDSSEPQSNDEVRVTAT